MANTPELEPDSTVEVNNGVADTIGGTAAAVFGGAALAKDIFVPPEGTDLTVVDTLLARGAYGVMLLGGLAVLGRGIKHFRQARGSAANPTPSSE